MSTYTYEHIWPCPPNWSMWRVMAEARVDLLAAVTKVGAVADGPIQWVRPSPDRLIARVPVRLADDSRAPAAMPRRRAGARRSTLARLRAVAPCPTARTASGR